MTKAPKGEILRWWLAFSGVALWFAYIWVAFAGLGTRGQQYCAEQRAAGRSCDYDYIPVLEVAVIPAFVVLAAYFFARFAFGICAPSRRVRRLHWSFAGEIDAVGAYPVPQIFAVLGLCWSIFRLSVLPFTFIPWLVILYWIAWIAWFSAAIIVSWPRKDSGVGSGG